MLDHARFLNWREQTLYDALLAVDTRVFLRLVDEVRDALHELRPRQVICESIELYNPLHDITLPIVRAAAAGLDVEIIEFALIAQEPADGERYRVQRFPAHRASTSVSLTDAEVDAKLRARDRDYLALHRSTGDVVDRVSRETARTEEFAATIDELPEPDRDHVLRYEWRGRLLRERGEVADVITFADHFVPLVNALRER